jgi:hypothetical protein
MFENQGTVDAAIKTAIMSAMDKWITEVTIENILISGINEDGLVQVVLLVTLPDYSSAEIKVFSATLNPDSTITR